MINTEDLASNQYNHLKALVVDDHMSMSTTIKGMLVTMGFKHVFTAINGKEALKVIESLEVDLIISDWNMPKMNGLELLKAIRQNKETANTPFIMLTGNIIQEDVIKAISSGVSEYLLKPFSSSLLKTKISKSFASPEDAPTQLSLPPAIQKELAVDKKDSLHNILIVDDEPNNITVLTELLKGKYNLQACLSGAKALEICNSEKSPDLILLDIMMPEMDGLSVCHELKSNHLTEHIPIIFITALSQTKDIVKGLSMGAVDYISKPITPEITLARVNSHIQLVKQRKNMVFQLDTMMENMRLKENIERVTQHDLRNPLSVIVAAADTLKEQETYLEQDVGLIAESANLIKLMLNEQMLILQLENNSVNNELLPINALSLINKIAYGQKEKCKQKGILIKYKMSNKTHYLGTELLCFNLFNNLLSNAIEASPENGEVTIKLDVTPYSVITTITNQGVIPEKIQARFFDKFITSGKENGTGLGTYSAKLSAIAQGGDIRFVSDKDNGTSLIVELTVAP